MVVDEGARHALHGRLDDVLGRKEATTLMSMLPTETLASKRDLDSCGGELRSEMTVLRTELRSEMTELRSELRGEMADLRSELRGDIAEFRGEMLRSITDLSNEVHKDFREYTRLMFFSMIMTMIMLAGLAFGAARLS